MSYLRFVLPFLRFVLPLSVARFAFCTNWAGVSCGGLEGRSTTKQIINAATAAITSSAFLVLGATMSVYPRAYEQQAFSLLSDFD